ncbi:Zinc finger CCCH domain-containing protein 19 [Apostasia shenzhenica]|uniref:Zinc finger CCCH domain-containing protein 19 n=1 Tax=Apostasia shenzhenica TaxID=1088818 RepID=A0A2I0AE64_9ASPA|nr:Zinc finger CCCH domain-containing protein 19 [Apostasia shenzhenica]
MGSTEEQQKRNTDCVYFLASPLTCKKGSECEYRHSHTARLNPSDCWYWLNGSCCNPSCAFRHPPVEGLNGMKTVPLKMHSQSVVPTSKSSVPCYFFFNAICNKGEQCSFLHGYFPDQKIMKAVSEVSDSHLPENKISASSDTGPASVELPADPPAVNLHLFKQNFLEEVLKQSAPVNVLEERSQSAEYMVPDHEEPTDNSHNALDLVDQSGQLSPYQSSEELMKVHVEPELDERWESSPGFDVLVDDGSEQLAYDDDGAEYVPAHNGESDLLHSQLLDYGFEGRADYDHLRYHDEGYLYGPSHYDNYDHIEDGYLDDFSHQGSFPNEERIFENGFDQKMKVMGRISSDQNVRDDGWDLRDHLRKHKRMNVHRFPLNSRKRRVSHARGTSQEKPMRCGTIFPNYCRLASEVGKSVVPSLQGDIESTIDDHHRQDQTGYTEVSRFKRARLRERERRRRRWNSPSTSCDRHQSTNMKFLRSLEVHHDGFVGPKTLAEIKEEKRRDKTGGKISRDFLQYQKRQETIDFEGPKPLEELLKGKRRSENANAGMSAGKECFKVSSMVEKRVDDANMSVVEDQDRIYMAFYETDDKYVEVDGSDGVDDDTFQKKVAHMLSN